MWRRGKDAHWHVGTWALPYMRLAGARHEEVQKTCPKVTHNGDWHSAIAQAEAILAKVTGMVMYRTRAEAYLAYARAVGETTKQDIEGEG